MTHAIQIRNANVGDVDILYELGIVEEGFAVSPNSRFYHKDYLKNWLERPDNDILLAAEIENRIVGFLFCRLMRNTWAMLENIAVSPSYREHGIGVSLLEECFVRLHAEGINYVAGIVKEGNSASEFFRKQGFSFGYHFTWIERNLRHTE